MSAQDKPRTAGASASRRAFLTGAGVLASTASATLLAACGRSSSSSGGSTAGGGSATAASSPNAASPLPSGSSVLVAYFSAQGHTKAVAETIAGELGASTFVIEPANPFSEDDLNWRNDSSRVVTEYENPDQRTTQLASNAPAEFASYDTVFLGYPLWWQSASWAMTDFARQNDFTGKTVIPFCTSTSSPIGSSGTELAEMAGGSGTWQEGMRFEENASTEEVAQWARQFRS